MSLRMRADLTPEILHELAVESGACVRPLLSRVTDTETGKQAQVALACGSTRDSKCPSCAGKARKLRMQQCREGWHLEEEPDAPVDLSDETKDDATDEGPDSGPRRVRSTRRRQDSPHLPRVPMDANTVGRTFTTSTGKIYRPSMFVTLTLPSYGPVNSEGVPKSPRTYDYRRAALDAIHFSKLVDRWWQNLRRCAGYRVQYFSTVEAQKRLAPHLHAGIRGAIPRELLRQVGAATYHQVWWPQHEVVVYDARHLPFWDEAAVSYVDGSGTVLPTWEEALDALDTDLDARPAHVVRLGKQLDIQGIIAESGDADRRVSYLCKYLTKSLGETYGEDETRGQRRHLERLHEEVRWLPCSPECANWLRYGVQPRNAHGEMTPGACPKQAHTRENLGLGGRRVLVSRNWTGKTLSHHRADRAAVVREVLAAAGVDVPDVDRCSATATRADGMPRFEWERIDATHQDFWTRKQALLASIEERLRWRGQYQRAKQVLEPMSHIGPSDALVPTETTFNERKQPCSTDS